MKSGSQRGFRMVGCFEICARGEGVGVVQVYHKQDVYGYKKRYNLVPLATLQLQSLR